MSTYKVKPLLRGTQILLRELWRTHGGVPYLAKRLGTHPQNLLNWKYQGHVPMDRVGEISRLIDVPQYALNYEGSCDFFSQGRDWEHVVEDCNFPSHIAGIVLKGKPPKPFKLK